MSGVRNDAQEAKPVPQQHAADTLYGHDATEDSTTLKFNGSVQVSRRGRGQRSIQPQGPVQAVDSGLSRVPR